MTVGGRQARQDGAPQKCREMQAAYVFVSRSKSSRPANKPRSAILSCIKPRESLRPLSGWWPRKGRNGMGCVCCKLQVCDGNGVRDGITACSALPVLRLSSVIP
jgi:hypothetical protein